MKKKVLIGLVVLISAIGLLAIFQKPHVIDVSDKYREYFERRFETKTDLIVFKYDDSKDLSLTGPGADMLKIEEVPQKLPYRWYGDTIYGVLPKGSLFRIVGAKRSTSATMGHDWFMVEIESEGPFNGQHVGTSSLEYNENGHLYHPKYALEVTPSDLKK